MAESNRAALGCAPIVLRVMLAVTFLWAGAGKVFKDGEFAGADAAALANMGLSLTPTREVVVPQSKMPAASTPAPSPATSRPPAVNPERPIQVPTPTGPKSKEPPNKPAKQPSRDGGKQIGQGEPNNETTLPAAAGVQSTQPPVTTQSTGSGGVFRMEDFPRAVSAPRLYSLAILTKNAATPKAADGGKTLAPYWPAFLSNGALPLYMAWAAALTELFAGALLLIGLFTRLAGFAVCVIMLNAMWLTQFGPAIQSGNVTLGVFPAHAWWDIQAWTPLLWQLSLFCSALALVLLGSGAASVDSRSASRPEQPKAEKHPRPI